jgi:hypothetical protein
MSDSGHKHIINVDYAQNVIEQMKEVTLEKEKYAHKDYSGLSWYVGDCLNNLPYYLPTTDKYSIVLDKSLSDCIACGDDEDQSLQKQLAMETLAVTDQDAIWLSVSFSNERKQDWSDANGCYWKLEKRVPVLVKQKNDKPNAPDIYYYLSIYRKAQIP